MSSRRKTVLVVAGVVFFVIALLATYFAISSVRRNAGVAAVRALGGTVTIKRVSRMFIPIPTNVCWVEFKQTKFDASQLDELIVALRRIGVRDCRIDLGQTTLNESQRKRLMRGVPGNTHLNFTFVANP